MVEGTEVIEERRRIEPELPPAPPAHRSHGARGITGAVLLIGFGAALLLDNLGIMNINWLGILQYWPVILILIGLDIMLSGRSALGSVFVALVALALVFGIIFLAGQRPAPRFAFGASNMITRPIEQPLGEVEALEVRLNLGAVEAHVNPNAADTYAVQGEYTTDERLQILTDYSTRGNIGVLSISQQSSEREFGNAYVGELDIDLTNAVPMSLDVDTGFGEVELNLSSIQLESLNIDTGFGEASIVLPEGDYDVTANTGVGSLTIDLPDDAEAHIHYDGGLSTFDPGDQFKKIGEGEWVTEGYQGGDPVIELTIRAGIGAVEIR